MLCGHGAKGQFMGLFASLQGERISLKKMLVCFCCMAFKIYLFYMCASIFCLAGAPSFSIDPDWSKQMRLGESP